MSVRRLASQRRIWRFAAGVLSALLAATAACGFSSVGELAATPSTTGDGSDGTDAGAEGMVAADGSPTSDAPGDSAVPEHFGAPLVVATGQFVLQEIACDDEAAFVAVLDGSDRSVILRIAVGVAPKKLASDQYRGRSTAVDDTRVFWVSGEPLGGHSYVRATLKNDVTTPDDYYDDGFGSSSFSALAIKATVLAFFVDTIPSTRIVRGATSGLGGFDVARSTGKVTGVAIDGPYVYWLPATGDVVMRSSTPDAGATATETFASSPAAAITSLAIANGEVFWTGDDSLLKALHTTTPNGVPRQVASGLAKPGHLAVDSRRAFWVDGATGAVATVPLAGGSPVVIGTGVASSTVAACSNAVWFTNPKTGEILRVARD